MRTTKAIVLAVVVAMLVLVTTTVQAQIAPTNMVLIPAGEFQMGDTFSKVNNQEHPIRVIFISAFYIDKYEVTKSLWDEVYRWATNHGYSFDNPGSGKATNHPIQFINWYDAVKWCNARSEREGLIPAYYTNLSQNMLYRKGRVDMDNNWVKWNIGYRLPTEAEWEKAARGGTSGHLFSWTNTETITHSQANYESKEWLSFDISPTRGYHPTYNTGDMPYTSPVGSFAPNGYGLYDMIGNVWDMCWDWQDSLYYDTSPKVDPRGGSSSSLTHVVRGGCWFYDAKHCRVAGSYGYMLTTARDYSFGFRTVLGSTITWKQVIEIQPKQPTYSEAPKKEDAKDSLVLVTHGWQPAWKPVDMAWVDDMTNNITTYIIANGLNNWQVSAHKWVEKARTPFPSTALDNAEQEGGNLGNSIANKEWKHVHLIAHSAGSALIRSATEKIKDKWKNTLVHQTFLDPYVGLIYGGRNKYGDNADWADSYFTKDLETSGEIFTLTEGALKYAFNVDVTFLDKSKTTGNVYHSSSGSVIQQCQEATTTHAWPYEFYSKTITGLLPETEIKGLGFQMSKEGGNWDPTSIQYKVGNDPSFVLGTPDPSCLPSLYQTTPAYLGQMNFSTTPSTISTTGVVQKNDFGFNLTSLMRLVKLQSLKAPVLSEGPAWIASTVTITNAVNLLSFETVFSSGTGAEGLLSVYWETNVIGTIDERVASSGIHQYTFPIPKVTNGIQTLGFRLDSFTNITSSVTVTNVSLGFAGVKEPFSLSFVGSQTDGLPILQLTGQKDFNYTVETSTNLIDWKVFAILVNTNGVVRFNSSPIQSTALFYRAVAQ